MNQIRNSFTSIEQVANQYLNQPREVSQKQDSAGVSFEDILKRQIGATDKTQELKFSKHATQRLDQRDIALSPDQSQRLEAGVQKASEKGITESLVIVDSLAFIVNVPNQTVVTAMDQTESMDNVFTNIDGAVII
ncbi:MAG: flagellar protein [Lachnospiraceae bacterium]|nr:flagellar protein [Lachnospiraceae bacterium]